MAQQPRSIQVFNNQMYAIPGNAVLGILNILKDELPVRNADTVSKIESVLASTVFPISLEGDTPANTAPVAPVVPNIPIVPSESVADTTEG